MNSSVVAMVTAASAALSCGLVGGPAAAAAEPFTVSSVTLSRTDVSVTGLDTVPVTVTVRGTNASAPDLLVRLARVGGTRPNDSAPVQRYVVLTRSGDAYTGTTHVPSTMNGTFEVDAVWADSGVEGDPDKRADTIEVDGPRLRVTGTAIPWIARLAQSPSPLPHTYSGMYTQRGQILDTASKKVVAGRVPVHVGSRFEAGCTDPGLTLGKANATTSRGVWSTRLRFDTESVTCVWLMPKGVNDIRQALAVRTVTPTVRGTVTARAASTSVKAGRTTTVTGTVKGIYTDVALQRFTGGRWKSVGTTRITGTEQGVRYSLTAQPPTRGTHRYRVAATTKPGVGILRWVPITSSTLTIRGR